MLLTGLTGGIGSGKSTVAAGLAEQGAAVVDADLVARRVVEPDGPAYPALVERFGSEVLHDDGTLDRAALAGVVFGDEAARSDLNRITHPRIAEAMGEQVLAAATRAEVVVMDVPLLDARGVKAYGLAAVVVVDTPTELAVERLVEHRCFTVEDARARVAAQMSREERRALADLVPGRVVDNSRDRTALEAEVLATWDWLLGLDR